LRRSIGQIQTRRKGCRWAVRDSPETEDPEISLRAQGAVSPETGRVTVTSDAGELVDTEFVAKPVNWLASDLPAEPLACSVQVRYRHASGACDGQRASGRQLTRDHAKAGQSHLG